MMRKLKEPFSNFRNNLGGKRLRAFSGPDASAHASGARGGCVRIVASRRSVFVGSGEVLQHSGIFHATTPPKSGDRTGRIRAEFMAEREGRHVTVDLRRVALD